MIYQILIERNSIKKQVSEIAKNIVKQTGKSLDILKQVRVFPDGKIHYCYIIKDSDIQSEYISELEIKSYIKNMFQIIKS